MSLYRELSVDLPNGQLMLQFDWDSPTKRCYISYVWFQLGRYIGKKTREASWKEGLHSLREWRAISES